MSDLAHLMTNDDEAAVAESEVLNRLWDAGDGGFGRSVRLDADLKGGVTATFEDGSVATFEVTNSREVRWLTITRSTAAANIDVGQIQPVNAKRICFPAVWDGIGQFCTPKFREQVWSPSSEEDKGDYFALMSEAHGTFGRTRLRFCFAIRTVIRVWQAIRASVGAKALLLIVPLVPQWIRTVFHWFAS